MSARRTASDTTGARTPDPDAQQLAARRIEAAALDDARDAVARLHAAAMAARDALAHACHATSYRRTADATGLPLATVTRWRYEVPVEPVIRTADARRDPMGSYAAEVERAANGAGR
ncbi:MAG: hypothetical protein OXH28_10980 [bacterium]|nr:hypothetical protein [bacterium]